MAWIVGYGCLILLKWHWTAVYPLVQGENELYHQGEAAPAPQAHESEDDETYRGTAGLTRLAAAEGIRNKGLAIQVAVSSSRWSEAKDFNKANAAVLSIACWLGNCVDESGACWSNKPGFSIHCRRHEVEVGVQLQKASIDRTSTDLPRRICDKVINQQSFSFRPY